MLKFFKNLIKRIKQWFRNFKISRLNKKLEKAVVNKIKNQLKLKTEILKEVRSFLKMDKDDVSKYIPYSLATRIATVDRIYHLFGERMAKLDVKFGTNFKFK